MTRKKYFIIFLALILTLACSGKAFAVYMWVDEKGQTHISDLPRPRPASSREIEPADSETAGGNALSDSHGQSLYAGNAPVTGDISKLTTAPVASVMPTRNEPVVALQSQQQPLQAGVTTTNAIPALPMKPVPAEVGHEPVRDISSAALRATALDNATFAKVTAAFLSMFLFALILTYLYFSLCLFLIARKLSVPAAWVAWIPIIQVWTFLASAGKPGWWALLFLVPVVNLIIPVYLWMCIVENLGREKWLGLLMLVPIVNFVYLGMLALSGSASSSRRTAVAVS